MPGDDAAHDGRIEPHIAHCGEASLTHCGPMPVAKTVQEEEGAEVEAVQQARSPGSAWQGLRFVEMPSPSGSGWSGTAKSRRASERGVAVGWGAALHSDSGDGEGPTPEYSTHVGDTRVGRRARRGGSLSRVHGCPPPPPRSRCPSNTWRWFRQFLVIYRCLDKGGGGQVGRFVGRA